MGDEIIMQHAKELRFEWIERWLSNNPFYTSVDPEFVLPYCEQTGAPYEIVWERRLHCAQLMVDLEELHAAGRLTKSHHAIIIDNVDHTVDSYMLHQDRFRHYY